MKSMKRMGLILLALCLVFGTIAFAAFAENYAVGTEQNPEDGNAKYFSGTRTYLLNTTLEAGDEDGYWYVFNTNKAGVLCIENSATMAYQIKVSCDGVEYYANNDGLISNSLSTYRLEKGQHVTIHLYALAEEGEEIPGGTIYANLYMVDGDDYEPVPVKSTTYMAYVLAGDEVCYVDSSREAAYCGQGLVVSGDAAVIANTVVTVSGVDYVDENGDGKIKLTVPGSFTSRPAIMISNGSDQNATYLLMATEPVSEASIENNTGHKLDYHPAVEPCHMNGMQAYWYCGICDVYYADAEATEVTNAKNLVIPADSELMHYEAVAPGCHYIGNVEYWYCSDCDSYWTDAEATELTNSKSVILPASGGDVTHIEAMEATCLEEGNIEHWICYECQQVWADEALTQLTNIKNVVTGKTDHIYEAGVCVHCGEKEKGQEVVIGDANGDGLVNARDARLILRYSAKLITDDEIDKAAADYNGDGSVNARDARAILRQAAGLT